MTGSGIEFPRKRENDNSVQSFALGLSTDSHAIAPGKPIQTDFSSEAKLRRFTVRPLWADRARKVRAVAPLPDTSSSRALVVFSGGWICGVPKFVFLPHTHFLHTKMNNCTK